MLTYYTHSSYTSVIGLYFPYINCVHRISNGTRWVNYYNYYKYYKYYDYVSSSVIFVRCRERLPSFKVSQAIFVLSISKCSRISKLVFWNKLVRWHFRLQCMYVNCYGTRKSTSTKTETCRPFVNWSLKSESIILHDMSWVRICMIVFEIYIFVWAFLYITRKQQELLTYTRSFLAVA